MQLPDSLAGRLLGWYAAGHRALPWREDHEPYHVWLSEIMLQQTRVEAVKGYYARFLSELPDIAALAACEENRLTKLWEGLGYYSRVRNLQKAARVIMTQHGGEFPRDYAAIRALPGVGNYTAGAVASICFDAPEPAVDGNVLRVLSRVTQDEAPVTRPAVKKAYEAALRPAYEKNPGKRSELTQSLMELGACVCVPNGAPKCGVCPVRASCMAYCKNQTAVYPVKAEKKPRTLEYLNVFFCVDGEKIAIGKRPKNGLLSGLWELPNGQRDIAPPVTLQEMGILEAELLPMKGQKHIFTHVEWHMDCYFVRVTKKTESDLLWLTREEAEAQYALPSAFKKIWAEGLKQME